MSAGGNELRDPEGQIIAGPQVRADSFSSVLRASDCSSGGHDLCRDPDPCHDRDLCLGRAHENPCRGPGPNDDRGRTVLSRPPNNLRGIPVRRISDPPIWLPRMAAESNIPHATDTCLPPDTNSLRPTQIPRPASVGQRARHAAVAADRSGPRSKPERLTPQRRSAAFLPEALFS
jgi:hypothetical protein